MAERRIRLNGGCSVAGGVNPRLRWRVEARVLLEPDNKEAVSRLLKDGTADTHLAVLCNQTPREKVGDSYIAYLL
ncbi:hypothetical protein V6N13_052535 [Hibiscus sabdariffa]